MQAMPTYHILIGYTWAGAHRLPMTPYHHEKESFVQHNVEHAQCVPLEPWHDDKVHSHVVCGNCHPEALCKQNKKGVW